MAAFQRKFAEKPKYRIAMRSVITDQSKAPYYRILRVFLYRKMGRKGLSKMEIMEELEKEEKEGRRKGTEPREYRLSYGTIYSTVRTLKQHRRLRIVNTERSRRGDTIEYYDLTNDGLFQALESAVCLEKKLDWRNIAANYHSQLPLVFGKWDYFRQMGTEDIAIQRLEMIFHRPILFDPEEGVGPVLLQERFPAEFLFQTGLSQRAYAPSRWLKTICNDEDLLALANHVAGRKYKRVQELTKLWKEYLDIFDKELLKRERKKAKLIGRPALQAIAAGLGSSSVSLA